MVCWGGSARRPYLQRAVRCGVIGQTDEHELARAGQDRHCAALAGLTGNVYCNIFQSKKNVPAISQWCRGPACGQLAGRAANSTAPRWVGMAHSQWSAAQNPAAALEPSM